MGLYVNENEEAAVSGNVILRLGEKVGSIVGHKKSNENVKLILNVVVTFVKKASKTKLSSAGSNFK